MARCVSILILLLGSGLLHPAAAAAGVPRACIHPQADPIACPEAMRRERRDVLPAARLRILDVQRRELLRVAPRQDLERNELLREILRELCARPRR